MFEVHFNESMVQDHVAIDEDEVITFGNLRRAIQNDGAIEPAVFMPDLTNL